MNNRNGLIAVGVVAVLAVLFAVIQSSSLSQTQTQLSAVQTTATAQQVAMAGQGTAAVATLEAAGTSAADAHQKAIVDAANQAATAQATAV
ncbi:MAG: hypothetical protein H0X30_00605, partial [Anaerolineae bacterium]|nr:hypothetical protein [Anaerolineae bacterium]